MDEIVIREIEKMKLIHSKTCCMSAIYQQYNHGHELNKYYYQ